MRIYPEGTAVSTHRAEGTLATRRETQRGYPEGRAHARTVFAALVITLSYDSVILE